MIFARTENMVLDLARNPNDESRNPNSNGMGAIVQTSRFGFLSDFAIRISDFRFGLWTLDSEFLCQ